MSNVFSQVSKKFENSIISIPIALACMLGLIASLAAMFSDYLSSYYGYEQLPTVKVGSLVWMIALIPQAGQIIFATAFIMSMDTSKTKFKANWWYFIITFFLLLWDNGTDMWFKTEGFTLGGVVTFIALIESIAVYTIGSEILFITSFGLLIYMLPLAKVQILLFLNKFFGDEEASGPQRPVR